MPVGKDTQQTAAEEMARLRDAYTAEEQSYNAMLVGYSGAGKTHAAASARWPIHFDMWDASGAVTLRSAYRKEVEEGNIIVDTRWGKEHLREVRNRPKGPQLIEEWKTEMDRRADMGYFDALGTYVLDSGTSFGEAIMNSIVIGSGKDFGVRSQAMWGKGMEAYENFMKMLCALPCDTIVTSHLEMIQSHNEDGIPVGRPYPVIISLGKRLSPKLPKNFSEVYHLEVDEKTGKRVMWTQPHDSYDFVKSNLGGSGIFKVQEEPNIQALLKKAGRPWEPRVA